MVGLEFQVLSSFALYIGKDQEGLICLPFDVGSSVGLFLSVLRQSHPTLPTHNRC